MAVCLGETDPAGAAVREKMRMVGEAAKKHSKCFMTFLPNTASAPDLSKLGISMFFVGSEQALMMAGAKAIKSDISKLAG